jgi:hypothetical protein
VLNPSLVLLKKFSSKSNFGAEKPPLRQAAGTLVAILQTTQNELLLLSKH